jgi:hypothetical protein
VGYRFGMKFFARAVITGFALAMGRALFLKVQKRLGLDDDDDPDEKKDAPDAVNRGDGATDPGLHPHRYS